MANILSAKKRIRNTERRTAINRDRRSRIRTSIKNVEESIASGNKDAAQAALKAAQPEICVVLPKVWCTRTQQRGKFLVCRRVSRHWLNTSE